MVPRPARALLAALLALPLLGARETPPGAGPDGDESLRALTALAQRIDTLAARGDLRLVRVQDDTDFPERRHLRYDGLIRGVRVFGLQVVREMDADGRTLSVFGRLPEGLDAAETAPALTADRAVLAAERASTPGSRTLGEPELVLLPREGRIALAWMLWVRLDHQLDRVFVDARTGAVVWRYSDLRTEAAVGIGTGVWGDRKKLSVDHTPDGYLAEDRLRPPELTTYDLRFDLGAANAFLETGRIDPAFVARDSDDNWTDGAVVDAHVYAGWTYDYYFKRHGRRGIDGRDLAVRSVTHFVPRSAGFANAFWDPPTNAMYYGDGDDNDAPYSGALDVVAHELTHGVTQYTWGGIYAGESGALDEAFSDIMATGVEFFQQPPGTGRLQADYFLGEDLSFVFDPPRRAVRSMENPSLFCSAALGVCDPDHYSRRYRGPLDNGGVHHNSGIANQAFYLLIEGGTNRTSGRHVTGLGAANRDRAERIFYRGFTSYLTPSATFADARAATLRATRDLYGEAEATQVAAAWAAVGVE